jgi:hypothetical protein
MNEERSFERFVADHVAGTPGGVRLPDAFYDDIHTLASRTRQRPEWLALIKEPPMRIDSRLGVGSPIARVAAIAVTTLLLTLLSVGALVAGAQSPPPASLQGTPLSFFSGTHSESAEGACQLTDPPSELVGDVARSRGVRWGCQVVTADDPRFSGEVEVIWNADTFTDPSGPFELQATRQRIENEEGAWEGTLTGLQVGLEVPESAGWFFGEGAYEGLAAYVMYDDWALRGVIRPNDGFGPPESFPEE